MCCCADYDPQGFTATSVRRSRRTRTCEECAGTIQRGEQYVRTVSKWEGRMSNWDTCLGCDEWAKGLMQAQREDPSAECVGYCVGDLWTCISEYVRELHFELYRECDDDEEAA